MRWVAGERHEEGQGEKASRDDGREREGDGRIAMRQYERRSQMETQRERGERGGVENGSIDRERKVNRDERAE